MYILYINAVPSVPSKVNNFQVLFLMYRNHEHFIFDSLQIGQDEKSVV